MAACRYFLVCVTLVVFLAAAVTSAASGLKPDEEIIFFPTSAHRDMGRGRWVVPVHGWVFEPEMDSVLRSGIENELLEWLELRAEVDVPDEELFRSRLRPFLVDSERGKIFTLKMAGRLFPTGPSGPNGHFTQDLPVEHRRAEKHADGQWLAFEVQPPEGDTRVFTGRVNLVPRKGTSVISDIDDTIKDSNVLDRGELLKNTFLREFVAVAGMAEVYRELEADGAVFHYVSSSPWQLYPALAEFLREEGFPEGSFSMKYFRIKDRTFFNLFSSAEKTKHPAVESIMIRYPERNFILIGDSSERDPEIYGEIYRRHPDQVLAVHIRKVPGSDMSHERFKSAFRGIPSGKWQVFSDPGQLSR